MEQEKQKYEEQLVKLKVKLEEEARSRDALHSQHNLQLESLKQDHQLQLTSLQSNQVKKSISL